MFNNIPAPVKWIVGTGVTVILLILLWLYATKGINGIQSFIFYKKANAEQAKINADLEKAKQQQAIIDQTLRDYKQAKADYDSVKAEKDKLEKVFNDQSKSAAEKVAAFKAALADDPVHTPTDNVTTDDLCARAKAIGSSPATITALCGQ